MLKEYKKAVYVEKTINRGRGYQVDKCLKN